MGGQVINLLLLCRSFAQTPFDDRAPRRSYLFSGVNPPVGHPVLLLKIDWPSDIVTVCELSGRVIGDSPETDFFALLFLCSACRLYTY